MMASIIGMPWRAARITDSGLPPTPIHVRSAPDSVAGNTRCPRRAARVLPRQVTGSCVSRGGEQGELLLEQLLVLAQLVAEQRKRLGERPASEDDLGPPVRQGIQRGEPLKHANGIVGAQHGDGGAEPDASRPSRDGREHGLGRRDGEVGAVMLAHADEVDAQSIGQHRLLDDVPDDLRMRQETAVSAGGDVAKGVQPQLEVRRGGRFRIQWRHPVQRSRRCGRSPSVASARRTT